MDLFTFWNFLHVGSAILWAGGTLVIAWFVSPAAQAAGPAAGPFMGALAKGRMSMTMSMAGTVVLVTGVIMWPDAVDGMPNDLRTWMLSIGALAGIVATGLGHGVQRKTAMGLGAIQAELGGNPPTPEQGRQIAELQAKLMRTGDLLAWIMVIAVIGMTFGSR